MADMTDRDILEKILTAQVQILAIVTQIQMKVLHEKKTLDQTDHAVQRIALEQGEMVSRMLAAMPDER
jgi:hypothetical protein